MALCAPPIAIDPTDRWCTESQVIKKSIQHRICRITLLCCRQRLASNQLLPINFVCSRRKAIYDKAPQMKLVTCAAAVEERNLPPKHPVD